MSKHGGLDRWDLHLKCFLLFFSQSTYSLSAICAIKINCYYHNWYQKFCDLISIKMFRVLEFLTSLDKSWQVSTSFNKSQQVSTSLNKLKQVLSSLHKSWQVLKTLTNLDKSQRSRIYQDWLSMEVSTDETWRV